MQLFSTFLQAKCLYNPTQSLKEFLVFQRIVCWVDIHQSKRLFLQWFRWTTNFLNRSPSSGFFHSFCPQKYEGTLVLKVFCFREVSAFSKVICSDDSLTLASIGRQWLLGSGFELLIVPGVSDLFGKTSLNPWCNRCSHDNELSS